MKKRFMEKWKRAAVLSMILSCLLCIFYLSMEEIPSCLKTESPRETAGYISGPERLLQMEDARELSSDCSRTVYLRQNSIKKQSLGFSRLIQVACITMLLLAFLGLTHRIHSEETVLYSHEFLIDYIHHQDGEK